MLLRVQVCISVPNESPDYKCECVQGYVQDPQVRARHQNLQILNTLERGCRYCDCKVNITWSGPPPVQGKGGSPVPAVRTQVRHPQAVPGQAQYDRHRQQHQVLTLLNYLD